MLVGVLVGVVVGVMVGGSSVPLMGVVLVGVVVVGRSGVDAGRSEPLV